MSTSHKLFAGLCIHPIDTRVTARRPLRVRVVEGRVKPREGSRIGDTAGHNLEAVIRACELPSPVNTGRICFRNCLTINDRGGCVELGARSQRKEGDMCNHHRSDGDNEETNQRRSLPVGVPGRPLPTEWNTTHAGITGRGESE